MIRYPKEDDGKAKWWKITLFAFTDYGSTHTPVKLKVNKYGKLPTVVKFANNHRSYDSWGGGEIVLLHGEPHCKTCSCIDT